MSEMADRLREPCVDWTGENIVRGSTPRYEIKCGLLYEAADHIEEQAARIAEAEKDYHEERKARYAAQSELVVSQARIEELEQKFRTTSLEALAISDTNNELQAEIETAKNDLRSFMTSFVREHFFDNTGWQPLPDLLGMLSQMDNASTIARTYRAQATAAEARLSEAVKVLKVISDTSHRTRDREHYKFPLVIMEWVDAFIATLGGEKNEE